MFTDAQLSEIRLTSLARVICDNADDINQIQPDVFKLAKFPDDMVTCDSDKIPYMDLKVWAHCCHGIFPQFFNFICIQFRAFYMALLKNCD